MDRILEDARQVALDAVAKARQMISQEVKSHLITSRKGDYGDLVTDLDYRSENVIVSTIRSAFPGHRIVSEEAGELIGETEWTWLVDPLDGTNNVVLGIPLFGSCVTLCHDGSPVVTAIYAGHEDSIYSAVRGHGATRNGTAIELRYEEPRERQTISWIQGYGVSVDDPVKARALAILERKYKRVLSLWSPSVDWALLVQGRTGAVVVFHNEIEDMLGGILLAAESGAIITDFDGRAVSDISDISQLIVAAPLIAPDIADALMSAS